MKEELLVLIPEFDRIKDKNLKQKTVRVWEKALKIRGMKPEDLLRMPFTLLIDPCPANFVEHTRGVVNVSVNAAQALKEVYQEKISINMDYLLSGALLHDVGKILEYIETDGKFVKSREGKFLRHPFSGVGLCFDEGIPHEIMHMIAVHAGEGDGKWRSTEGIIIHHADFINFEPFHSKN